MQILLPVVGDLLTRWNCFSTLSGLLMDRGLSEELEDFRKTRGSLKLKKKGNTEEDQQG